MGRARRKKNRKMLRRAVRRLGYMAFGALAEFAGSVLHAGSQHVSRGGKKRDVTTDDGRAAHDPK